jgi:hypothetical protein
MTFTVFYHNEEAVKAQVYETLIKLIKEGVNFSLQETRTNIFQTVMQWPGLKAITHLPLNIQCEELEWKDEKLTSKRQLVINV